MIPSMEGGSMTTEDQRKPVPTAINCFKCNGELESVWHASPEEVPVQPHKGVMFLSGGNYGSQVWDPCTSTLSLRIIICDACLMENSSNALVMRKIFVSDKYEYEPFNPSWDYR